MITDEVNEICVCDEFNGYFYNPFYGADEGCELDCAILTGDSYRVTNDNINCDACAQFMSLNTTDNYCWYDCELDGVFTIEGFYTSSYLWNDWFNYYNAVDGSYRASCLSCQEVGG